MIIFYCFFVLNSLVSLDKQEVQFFKNGEIVAPNDFSFAKQDKLVLKLSNNNPNITFRLDKIELAVVPSREFQDWKKQERYWRRYAKTKIQTSENFESQPSIELKFRDIYNKECTRLIIRILEVSEKKQDGTISPSRKVNLGIEYSFWNEEQ